MAVLLFFNLIGESGHKDLFHPHPTIHTHKGSLGKEKKDEKIKGKESIKRTKCKIYQNRKMDIRMIIGSLL